MAVARGRRRSIRTSLPVADRYRTADDVAPRGRRPVLGIHPARRHQGGAGGRRATLFRGRVVSSSRIRRSRPPQSPRKDRDSESVFFRFARFEIESAVGNAIPGCVENCFWPASLLARCRFCLPRRCAPRARGGDGRLRLTKFDMQEVGNSRGVFFNFRTDARLETSGNQRSSDGLDKKNVGAGPARRGELERVHVSVMWSRCFFVLCCTNHRAVQDDSQSHCLSKSPPLIC